MRSEELTRQYEGQSARLQQLTRCARSIAREIEKLAPAIDREASPQNAEYPWEDNGQIVIPCEFDYPNLSSLQEARGREFLALISRAITKFESISI